MAARLPPALLPALAAWFAKHLPRDSASFRPCALPSTLARAGRTRIPVTQVLGPDPSDVDYVVWQADQDAYAFSGQKCSAQSMLVAHEKWMGLGIVDKLRAQAAKRSLADLTISPVLTWPTPKILEHMNACLKLPGAELAFGGTPLTGHSIPDCYGAMPPTAVYVPIETIMASDANFALATTELFGPFQIITSYKEGQLALVIQMLNQMQNHLTAGVVSNDLQVSGGEGRGMGQTTCRRGTRFSRLLTPSCGRPSVPRKRLALSHTTLAPRHYNWGALQSRPRSTDPGSLSLPTCAARQLHDFPCPHLVAFRTLPTHRCPQLASLSTRCWATPSPAPLTPASAREPPPRRSSTGSVHRETRAPVASIRRMRSSCAGPPTARSSTTTPPSPVAGWARSRERLDARGACMCVCVREAR